MEYTRFYSGIITDEAGYGSEIKRAGYIQDFAQRKISQYIGMNRKVKVRRWPAPLEIELTMKHER